MHPDVARLAAAIKARARDTASTTDPESFIDSAPAPVARYLHHVLPDAKSKIALARYEQRGSLRPSLDSGRWLPFRATHLVAPDAAAFLWQAQVPIFAGLQIQVVDSLLDGVGAGQVAILSRIRVASAGDTPQVNAGSLHRFLAEAPWYPSALVPSASMRWTPIDDMAALATLTSHRLTVSVEFGFNEQNEMTRIFTPGRWGSFGGEYLLRPWEGHFAEYARRDGFLVPSAGEVGWWVGDQWCSVWKGSIGTAHFEVV